jgi:hypothetical protein
MFRGDVTRGVYFNNTVSTGHIATLLLFITGLVLWLVLKKKFPLEHPYPRISPSKEKPSAASSPAA